MSSIVTSCKNKLLNQQIREAVTLPVDKKSDLSPNHVKRINTKPQGS